MLSGPTLVAVIIFTILLMLGLGTTPTAADFRRVVILPRGVSIGLASQYGWMPLLGFTAAIATGLADEKAIGLMLMKCASGGHASNMFSWFARADVALSVTMTAISSTLTVVAMPVLLGIYTGRSPACPAVGHAFGGAGCLKLARPPPTVEQWGWEPRRKSMRHS